MISPIWRLISIYLALGAFLAVGVIDLVAGDDLIWSVGKAIVSFFACWIVLGWLGGVLSALVEKQDGGNLGSGAHGGARDRS